MMEQNGDASVLQSVDLLCQEKQLKKVEKKKKKRKEKKVTIEYDQ